MDPATDLEARSTGNGTGHGDGVGGASNGSGIKLTTATNATNAVGTAANGPPSSDDDAAHDDSDTWASAVTSPASITSPPYWTNSHSHQRSISNMSAESVLPAGAITMQDHEVSDPDHHNKACWAKSVEIVDHVVINGSATNIGAFVVWNIKVETLRVSCPSPFCSRRMACDGVLTGNRPLLQGSYMNIRKRYSEFDDLREKLMMTFPHFEAAVPPLPPKSVISKFRPKFLDKRRQGLQYFLKYVQPSPLSDARSQQYTS
ncbi:PX domain-containing protein [Verticillium dahliae VdLs.17]|uniref:Endosomal/vacuolar adapter protein YPT35 n=1 Tax=Verticillium dahliae (strain VdLs.17 / ATCC MYA-4575 / FGSC 10137) TaxID=498257 RepID=G2WTD2_VERDV|nr:PX domain-containing protein [Verticillium dahliae VdLs.17]EGY17373.1 PX domain-containing protein [Verticillium dahliae VdLs.17]